MNRELNIKELLEKKSFFLFGPRGVGKSYLIRQELKNFNYINLLSSKTYLRLKAAPWELKSMISTKLVAIAEIQRIPELLNEVHLLIEEKGLVFLLTGSSARKLKRGKANLLAGRARTASMFPLTWKELDDNGLFDLQKYLRWGGLPTAYLDEDSDYLYSYVETYLKEEIQAEALVRNLANYTRFLQQVAMKSSEIVNYTKIGNDAQLSPNTVKDYYQILSDTLLGYELPAWTKSTKRKAIQTSKFYLFDCGVLNALHNVEQIYEQSSYYGKLFEQFICNELKAYLSYRRLKIPLTYWRSINHLEVDFILGDQTAIEVKASKNVTERDHKGLVALGQENKLKNLLIVSRDTQEMTYSSGIKHIYWQDFLKQLWEGAFN